MTIPLWFWLFGWTSGTAITPDSSYLVLGSAFAVALTDGNLPVAPTNMVLGNAMPTYITLGGVS